MKGDFLVHGGTELMRHIYVNDCDPRRDMPKETSFIIVIQRIAFIFNTAEGILIQGT